MDAGDLPGYIVEVGGRPRGLLTYQVSGGEVEVVTIQTEDPGAGHGQALMGTVKVEAERLGARRVWLMTTNNNLGAIRFYRRWGMMLVAVYPGAVEVSRRVKPSIPHFDDHHLPIRDELEFALRLR